MDGFPHGALCVALQTLRAAAFAHEAQAEAAGVAARTLEKQMVGDIPRAANKWDRWADKAGYEWRLHTDAGFALTCMADWLDRASCFSDELEARLVELEAAEKAEAEQ